MAKESRHSVVSQGQDRSRTQLMQGNGLGRMEALRGRVKELDVEWRELTVRNGKGSKDQGTMVPIGDGPGNGCSPSTSTGATTALVNRGDTIRIRAWFRKPSAALRKPQRSTKQPPATAAAIPLPAIDWSAACYPDDSRTPWALPYPNDEDLDRRLKP